MDTRSSGTGEEPTPRQRLASVPSERPPLPPNASDKEIGQAYASMAAAYAHTLSVMVSYMESVDAKLTLRAATVVPALPRGYRMLWVLVVLLSVGQAADLWLQLSAHFGR